MISRGIGKSAARSVARSLSQFGSGSGGVAPLPPLLDAYPGAAAAYSLRKLSSSYSGSAIRVRRASDSAEQDIGFSGNDLDTASLTSFCAGTDGFVTTWYDQSGNTKNATQATTTRQPKVVASGSVVLLDGKSAIETDGSDDWMQSPAGVLSTAVEDALFLVIGDFPSSSNNIALGISNGSYGSNSRWVAIRANTDFQFTVNYGNALQASAVSAYDTARHVFVGRMSLTEVELLIDGTSKHLVSKVNSVNLSQEVDVRAADNSGTPIVFSAGKSQEIVIYESDLTQDVVGVFNNANSYWGVYS